MKEVYQNEGNENVVEDMLESITREGAEGCWRQRRAWPSWKPSFGVFETNSRTASMP